MPYTPIYPSAFEPARRWAAVDAMLMELLTSKGLQAQYRPVAAPYFEPARRWADVQAMLDVLAPTNPVPVYPWAFATARRWVDFDAMMQDLYSSTGPTLSATSLAAPSTAENTSSGTTISGILGKTAGSVLTLVDDAGGRFAISGTTLVAGLTPTDYETATSHNITIRETLAGATNSPRDTVLTIAVTNIFEQPNLSALSLSAVSYTIGTAASGAITGATAGSSIVASGLPSGLTINGPARTWAWSGSGSAGSSTVVLTETLADSANSPRASNVGVTVAPAGAVTFAGTPPAAIIGQPYDWQATVTPAGSAINLDAATVSALAARNISHNGFGRFTSAGVTA